MEPRVRKVQRALLVLAVLMEPKVLKEQKVHRVTRARKV
jgi:hypothetical protein